MPVVLTDFTNRTWCVEQPNDGYLHVGLVGKPGPKLEDVLDFIETRKAQFEKFVNKKRMEEHNAGSKRTIRRIRDNSRIPEDRGNDRTGEEQS